MPDKDHPGVIAPPPLIYGLPLLAGIAVHYFIGGMDMGVPAGLRWGAGSLVIAAGAALNVLAVARFRRVRTNLVPYKPATALVSDGVYRLTRNPIYLGMALIYAGVAVMLDCLFTLALLVPVLVVMHYGVIRREERYLERTFGEDYRTFTAKTRRWL